MKVYINKAGTTLEVINKGKGFITRRHYTASKHTPAETVEKTHKHYGQVQRIIDRFGFEERRKLAEEFMGA